MKDSTQTSDSQVKKAKSEAKEEKPAVGVKEVDLVSKGISRPSAAAHVQVCKDNSLFLLLFTEPELFGCIVTTLYCSPYVMHSSLEMICDVSFFPLS